MADSDTAPAGADPLDGLRRWSVAGGVVRNKVGHLLLVENERRNGSIDWSTPGGVVDEGESFVDALTREVTEETGIVVASWTGPLYRVEVTAPELGFHLEVEAHGALEFSGEIAIEDPDGIVLSAAYLELEAARHRLASAPRFVSEPLLSHVVDGVDDGRTFSYWITGSGSDRVVERR